MDSIFFTILRHYNSYTVISWVRELLAESVWIHIIKVFLHILLIKVSELLVLFLLSEAVI